MEVSTVDGFQGRERDTIVFNAVNTEKYGLRFAGNKNQFNVACTRPKDQFIMVGNRTAIEENASWENTLRSFIRYTSTHGGVFNWDKGEWVDGIDPADAPSPVPRSSPEIVEPPSGQPDDFDSTTTTSDTSNTSGGDSPSTTSVDPQLRS